MRLLPTTFGCMILVLLAASSMAQPLEAIPAGPSGPPVAGQLPPGQYSLPYGMEQPAVNSPWTVDTTNPVPRQPGERTPYGGEATYIDPSCANWMDHTTYDVRLEGALFKLDRARDQPLLLLHSAGPPVSNTAILNVGDLDYNFEPGARLTIAYDSSPEEGTKIEGTYFGVYDWGQNRTVNSASNNLQLPGQLGADGWNNIGTAYYANDYNSAASMAFRTDARLNSVEASLIYTENNRPWAFLAGVRFIRFEEGIFITSRRETPQVLPPAGGGGTVWGGVSNFNETTNNNLFGIQGGMRTHRCSGPWDLTTTFKFGLYSGTASAHNFETNSNGMYVARNFSPSDTEVAYSAEANVALSYALRKNLMLTGSYNVLWLSQIARATDNLDFSINTSSGTILNRASTAFFNGMTVGLEARW